MSYRFADFFAGIGGFRIGFEKAGHMCVFSCEKDTKCREVYSENFDKNIYEDITTLVIDEVPDFDIFLAGFPCQPFSISGIKKGFEDSRGTLFFDICYILDGKRPPVVILENVKNIIYHDNKRTFDIILKSLTQLGYYVNHKVLNAKDFGLPQNRERLFIVATLNEPFDFGVLDIKEPVSLRDFIDVDSNLPSLDKSEYTLIDNPVKQKSGLMFVGYLNKNMRKTGVKPNTEHLSRAHRQPNRIYSIDGDAYPTLLSQEPTGRYYIYIPEHDVVRKLTLDECYRLMGFPEDFKRHHKESEQYKHIGNSVAVPIIYEIAKHVKNYI